MPLIAFLLKHSSCPIHPPRNMSQTDSITRVSFACSEKLQNCWESVYGVEKLLRFANLTRV